MTYNSTGKKYHNWVKIGDILLHLSWRNKNHLLKTTEWGWSIKFVKYRKKKLHSKMSRKDLKNKKKYFWEGRWHFSKKCQNWRRGHLIDLRNYKLWRSCHMSLKMSCKQIMTCRLRMGMREIITPHKLFLTKNLL